MKNKTGLMEVFITTIGEEPECWIDFIKHDGTRSSYRKKNVSDFLKNAILDFCHNPDLTVHVIPNLTHTSIFVYNVPESEKHYVD
jgi:hypothetical protein